MAEGNKPCQEIDLSNPDSKGLTSGSLTAGSYSVKDANGRVFTNIQHATNVQMSGSMTVYMGADSGMKKKIKPKKPLTQCTAEVTMDQLLTIKDQLGRDWKDLGRRLGFRDGELDQLRLEHKDDMSELNYQILHGWRRRNPDSATQARLAKIFNIMFRGDLADLLVDEDN